MIALAAAGVALIVIFLALPRLAIGPTLQDRLLAANLIVGKAVLIVAAAAVISRRGEALDAAFALLLAMFVLNLAALRFFKLGSLQAPLARSEEAR